MPAERRFRRRRLGAALVWLALPLTASSWGLYALRERAVAVVVDIPVGALLLGGVALALAGAGLLLMRSFPEAGRKLTRSAGLAAMLGALLVLVLLGTFTLLRYYTDDVRFRSGDVALAGTVYIPRGTGPYSGVALVHGSGPESRREYAFYAQYLARRGIAALVYDKRGVGESTGELYRSNYADYAADAVAAVRLLANWPRIETVGLVGFSEAEWVLPLVALQSDRVAFIALIGASGMSPAEQVASEIALRLRARGHGDSIVDEALAINERVFAYQRSGEGAAELSVALNHAREQPWFKDAEDIPERVHPAEDYAWWRSVMDFDAAPVWAKVDVPVLLLKGERDQHSPPEPMRQRITEALSRGGNRDVTVRTFPDADHAILVWPRGEGRPPPEFARGYLETLTDWIRQRGVQ